MATAQANAITEKLSGVAIQNMLNITVSEVLYARGLLPKENFNRGSPPTQSSFPRACDEVPRSPRSLLAPMLARESSCARPRNAPGCGDAGFRKGGDGPDAQQRCVMR